MLKNIKKRIYTSIILLLILLFSFINNYFMAYFLTIVGVFSIIEFTKIIRIIFPNNKIKEFILNSIFIIYIFSFCSILIIFSSFFYLKILFFLILLTCIGSDIGGFTIGNIFKGPKLTKLSPKKTISGSLGSVIFSIIFLSILIYLLTKNFDPYILVVGIITSIACQLGDLFFSFLKRKSLLKDTGNFLPGHGGILDRIDGILLGMPVGFLSLLLIY
tara:strand:- start:275 stop:925 length:651 start_codon:yes stop_codon:yes gene_type:complete